MNARHPTGTAFARAVAQAPAAPALPLDRNVPNPGERYGKAEVIRATLLAMRGDASRVVPDATQWYAIARQLGITITTRKTAAGVRIWRIK